VRVRLGELPGAALLGNPVIPDDHGLTEYGFGVRGPVEHGHVEGEHEHCGQRIDDADYLHRGKAHANPVTRPMPQKSAT